MPGTHENSRSMTLPTDDQAVVPVPEDQPRSSMSLGFSQSMPVSDETEPSGAPSALPSAPEPQRPKTRLQSGIVKPKRMYDGMIRYSFF